MAKKKAIFIINPISNQGQSLKILPIIKDQFKDKYNCKYIKTRHPKEAIEISKNLSSYDFVFSVGGDGTVHEIVNGLALSNNNRSVLGVIPAGSGNDYCHTLGLSKKIKKNCRQLLNEDIREIDLGLVNGVYFANSLGIGFDARIAYLANQIKDEVGKSGIPLYLAALLRILKKDYYFHQISIQYDNGPWHEHEILLTAITIGPTYGGGFKITPQAICNDGELDICLIDPIKKNEVLLRLPFVIIGRHHWMKQEHHFKAKKINIQSENELPAELDGELMLSASYSIEIIPKGLKVLSGKQEFFK